MTPEIYATINMAVQRRFDSGYALTLYENCLRYKSVGSTGWWSIERFRTLMGASAAMYEEFKYLKRDVIVKPVTHVNRVADIHIEPQFQKSGRRVTSIRFQVTPSAQQSLLSHEPGDAYAELRAHPTYQRLMAHGIGDRLAISWLMQDEQRASAAIEYVEAKDKKQQIKGSTAGYIRKLIEDKAEVGASAYKAQQEAHIRSTEEQGREKERQQKVKELQEKFSQHLHLSALKALTLDERNAHAQAWFQTAQGRGREPGYNPQTGEFRHSVDRAQFNHVYLRKALAQPGIPKAFKAWLKTAEKINPKDLGL